MKICSSCKIEKPKTDFSKQSSNPDGLRYKCKECQSARYKELRQLDSKKYNEYSKKYRNANKEKYAQWRYKTRHGINKDEMFSILESQGNVCLICKTTDPGAKGWIIDHDHSCCGDINSCNKCRRGILCDRCNKMLGFAKDNIEVLTKAVEYLEEYERSR